MSSKHLFSINIKAKSLSPSVSLSGLRKFFNQSLQQISDPISQSSVETLVRNIDGFSVTMN